MNSFDLCILVYNNIEVSARGVMLLPQGLPFFIKFETSYLVFWRLCGNSHEYVHRQKLDP